MFLLRQSATSVPWGFERCSAAGLQALDVAIEANATERAEHEWAQMRVWTPLQPRRCRVLAGVDAVAAPASRALAAAMLIARKRNRLPQNVARRDNRSSQCSLL